MQHSAEPSEHAEPSSAPLRILIIDDDPIVLHILQAILSDAGHEVQTAESADQALAAVRRWEPDVVVLDVMLPDRSGESLLLELRTQLPTLPVIMLSAQDSVGRAIEIMKLRPYDYLPKPVDADRLRVAVQRAAQELVLTRRVAELERELRASSVRDESRFDQLIGASAVMRRLFAQIETVIDSPITVFITGESGTGKELVARAIHHHGPRRSGPFVALNCGAIADSLQESELFGHERGAFTGAVATHRGVFERAHRGTLFLDELGELSAGAQTRLLRVLQESRIQRVGGTQDVAVDVRFIAATHRDLEALVREGRFREDLFYRLVVYPIDLPALRERRDDIPVLVQHFLYKYRAHSSAGPRGIERDTLDVLCRYDWPGNVRELENVIQRALVAQPRGTISMGALPPKLVMRAMGLDVPTPPVDHLASGGVVSGVAASSNSEPAPAASIVPLDVLERDAIERAIRALDGNVSLAAERLGIGRATMYRKLAQYGRPSP
jgi:DNA-binding NtrC family response regulator